MSALPLRLDEEPAFPAHRPEAGENAGHAERADPASVRIDVPLTPGHEDARGRIAIALAAIAPFVAQATADRQDAVFREVVDRIVEATPIRPLDAQRAALEQRAIAAIFEGTEWLTAEQVGRLRDPAARNPYASANRWRAEGRLYAVHRAGVQYHPRYALDETYEPLPVIAEVLRVFDGMTPFRIASWFESTNGRLGGRRPRQALHEPDAVIAAARAHAVGPVHG